ncbi:MAG TPA: hypothetical protein VE956_05265 [Nodularia sp. (in: cyanobacteria)]|nr:hypothetical protein [Nodularia sp. (in: cyanobacteria)]
MDRGFYYENWRPGATPTKERNKEAFLQHIRDYFRLLTERIRRGEIDDGVNMMPPALRELWTEEVRA